MQRFTKMHTYSCAYVHYYIEWRTCCPWIPPQAVFILLTLLLHIGTHLSQGWIYHVQGTDISFVEYLGAYLILGLELKLVFRWQQQQLYLPFLDFAAITLVLPGRNCHTQRQTHSNIDPPLNSIAQKECLFILSWLPVWCKIIVYRLLTHSASIFSFTLFHSWLQFWRNGKPRRIVDIGGHQEVVGHHTRTLWLTVHTCHSHSAWSHARSRLEAQTHAVSGDNPSFVFQLFPREMSSFWTLKNEMKTWTWCGDRKRERRWGRKAYLLMMQIRMAKGSSGKPGMHVLNAATSEKDPLP